MKSHAVATNAMFRSIGGRVSSVYKKFHSCSPPLRGAFGPDTARECGISFAPGLVN